MLRFSNTKLSMLYSLLSAGVALRVILDELLDKTTVQGWSAECGSTLVKLRESTKKGYVVNYSLL